MAEEWVCLSIRGTSSIGEFPFFITCRFLHKNYGGRMGVSSIRDASSIRRITVYEEHTKLVDI